MRLPGPVATTIVFLSLAAGVLLASSFPLLDPDEGRNAEVAREMVATRDFVVPHLAGMPYLDKPPALFWATALSIALGGATPLAARMPAALAAAFTLLLLARAAERRGGPGFAVRATALLATAPLFAVLSAYVIFDMPLALCVTVLWLSLADEMDEGTSAKRRVAMFAAVTAGVLLKGPVMIAWAVGGSLATALIARSRSPLRWLGWWPGWVMVLGVAGGWFALASRRYPEYPHYAFLEESLERMTSGSFKRDQPWWFALAVLAGGALPWSLATPWGRRDTSDAAGLPRRERIATASHAALGFLVFAVVFFTVSRSKLVTYLLPALPPLAWLAAEAWANPARERSAGVRVAVVYGVLAVAAGIASRLSLESTLGPRGAGALVVLSIAFAVCGALGVVAARAGRRSIAFLVTLLFTPLVLVVGRPLLQQVALRQSGEPLARAIRGSGPAQGVRFEFCYSPGAEFSLGHDVALVSPLGFETTSTYQRRYRASLIARGEWTAADSIASTRGLYRSLGTAPPSSAAAVDRSGSFSGSPGIVVRPLGRAKETPAPGTEFFRDARFVAYRTR
jgi:4-amino-4-deoxy-L-arabinose transferase-like glycosyltransferase